MTQDAEQIHALGECDSFRCRYCWEEEDRREGQTDREGPPDSDDDS